MTRTGMPASVDDRPPTTDDRSVVAPEPPGALAPEGPRATVHRPPSVVAPEAPAVAREAPQDFLPILGVEYVEFWVGNARQAAQ